MDIQSLDPAAAYDYFVAPLVRMVYEGLVDYDDGVGLVPCLAAELPALSPDRRTYTFRLKPGVRFSNGRELTAADFVSSLERVLNPATKSPGEGYFRNIVGARAFVEARERDAEAARRGDQTGSPTPSQPIHVAGLRAIDRHTLQIELERPDPTFLHVLALPYASVVSAVAEAGADFYRRPVGTGPFVLAEWTRGVRLRFERNPDYHVPGRPHLDAVELVIGADDVTQQMMFERGELDIMLAIAGPDFARLRQDPRWTPCFSSQEVNATYYLALNCEQPPFTDVRVRRALNHAIDRDRLLRLINGRGVPAKGVLPPRMPGYNPQLRGYPYDPEEARRLLAEAGYPDGFSVTLWVAADSGDGVKMMEAVQQDLARVNVRLELKAMPGALWVEAVGHRRNVACSFTNWFQTYPDPADVFDLCLNGERITDTHCNNTSFYSKQSVNDLLRTAASEPEPGRRLDLYRQAEAQVVDDAPWVFLYHPVDYRMHQPWVKDDRMHPVWAVRYDRLRKERP
jgi:ABC-type transport system substrate-binding protein